MIEYAIPIQTGAFTKVFQTIQDGSRGHITLTVVGLLTTEEVIIEVPRVASPVHTNDAHWTPLYQNGEVQSLKATNNSITIPTNLIVRLKKLDSGANAFGVRIS